MRDKTEVQAEIYVRALDIEDSLDNLLKAINDLKEFNKKVQGVKACGSSASSDSILPPVPDSA